MTHWCIIPSLGQERLQLDATLDLEKAIRQREAVRQKQQTLKRAGAGEPSTIAGVSRQLPRPRRQCDSATQLQRHWPHNWETTKLQVPWGHEELH